MLKGRLVPPCTLLALAALVLPGSGRAADDAAQLSRDEIATDVLSTMDRTVDPCQDFYRYACGGWLDRTELPPDEPRWGRSFSVVRERNREVIREIVEQAAADPGDDPDRRRIGAFYGACMDEPAIAAAGVAPLAPLIEEVDAIEDPASFFRAVGHLHRRNVNAAFTAGVLADYKNPDLNVAVLLQGGLGLPDRDYYVSEAPDKRELLADYERHVATMFSLTGDDEPTATARAASVVALESRLAAASRDRAAMRDREKLYHRMSRRQLGELAPGLPWAAYLAATGYPDTDDFNVMTPEFFEALAAVVGDTDPAVLRSYLRWNVLNSTAHLLTDELVAADFSFYGVKLAGQKELQPRWKRCVNATSNAMGEAVGKLYVERMFAGDSKVKALEMIHDIEAAFAANLETVGWMDDETKERARAKLATLRNKIGYPDAWRDYSSMKVSRASYFSSALAAAEYEFDRQARQVGKPVDRNEWFMSPQEVNAYNNPTGNEIVFPAGILQPPFFHRDFPAAMNYGGIGYGIAHELTHGYDDQGRKFDLTGKLSEWWAPEVAARYEERAECVADAFEKYEVEPGIHLNGRLTLGENIADLGGIKLAHAAYHLWEKRHGTPPPLDEGLTNEQLLFLNAAQTWCMVASPEYLRMQVTTDPHSPARFRVIGPMSNLVEFAEAFGCEPGTPMNPGHRCEVW